MNPLFEHQYVLTMQNIFLRDDTSSIEQSKTIIAKTGYIIKRNEQNILTLFDFKSS